MVCIKISDGPNKGAVYLLGDEVVTIGRDNDVRIQIMDQGVSRRHAEIFRVGEMYFLRDLTSRNGTFVNEQRVTEELLRENDRIRIGQTTLVLVDTTPAQEDLAEHIEFSHMEADPGATMEFRFGVMDFADIEESNKVPARQVAESHEPKHLAILYQAARAVSSGRNPKKILAAIVELSAQAVEAEQCYIFAKPEIKSKRELNLEASYEKEGATTPAVSKTIIKRVFKYGRAILTSDASTDQRFSKKSSVIMQGTRSVICAPLVAMEQIIGVIYLSSSDPGVTFSTEDLELITAIGINTGMALNSFRIATEQRKMFTSIISALVSAVEIRDPAIKGLTKRVARYAKAMAKALSLPQEEISTVSLAALLHNIGRLTVSEADIVAARTASAKEQTLEYKLAMGSEELLEKIEGLREILPAVKHSFEKYDGSGCPDGLAGEEIPLHARIIAAARAFAKILADESADKLATKEALFKLNALAQEGQIDPELVKAIAIAFRMGILEVNE